MHVFGSHMLLLEAKLVRKYNNNVFVFSQAKTLTKLDIKVILKGNLCILQHAKGYATDRNKYEIKRFIDLINKTELTSYLYGELFVKMYITAC